MSRRFSLEGKIFKFARFGSTLGFVGPQDFFNDLDDEKWDFKSNE